MNIVLVEDDHLQADPIMKDLQQEWPTGSISLVKTESEFRKLLPQFAVQPPTIFVIDVMVRWIDPSPKMTPPPPDVKEAGFFKAGLRCVRLLTERGITSPVILYTILEHEDIAIDLESVPQYVKHLRKEPNSRELIKYIRELIS